MRRALPNQTTAFDYPNEAWEWAKNIIASFGDNVITEDGKLCREVCNLQLTILKPSEGWPLKNSNWSISGLNQYAEQLMNPDNPGFDYTYGERLRGYPISRWSLHIRHFDSDRDLSQDQIQPIISKLRENPNTRRAIAITWVPEVDIKKRHVPCLQSVNFLYRHDKLHLTAYFRSHDIQQAWPANVYGLSKLLDYVAFQAGMQPGSLTPISASAHVYEV